MEKVIAYVFLVLGIALPILLGIFWLMWQFWMWLIPQIWVAVPQEIARPKYLVFIGAFVLIKYLGYLLFGQRKAD